LHPGGVQGEPGVLTGMDVVRVFERKQHSARVINRIVKKIEA